jgi:hypothetical protein
MTGSGEQIIIVTCKLFKSWKGYALSLSRLRAVQNRHKISGEGDNRCAAEWHFRLGSELDARNCVICVGKHVY